MSCVTRPRKPLSRICVCGAPITIARKDQDDDTQNSELVYRRGDLGG